MRENRPRAVEREHAVSVSALALHWGPSVSPRLLEMLSQGARTLHVQNLAGY